MANEKFRVKFGLAVGDNTTQTTMSVDGATGDIYTNGDATVNENLQVNGTSTLGNTAGDTVSINGDTTVFNALTIGSGSGDTLTVNSQVAGNVAFTDNNTTTPRGVLGTVANNDQWFVGGAAVAGVGYAMIATGDDAQEPIYARQYSGSPLVGTVTREATILDATGNTVLPGNLAVNGGDITTTDTGTAALFNTNATTVNIAGAATTVSIGANTGTTTVNNSLVADDISITTVDTTNLEVTNIKAKDGIAAMTIANTTGDVNISSSLTVDNIDIRINTISATDTNGSINLTPNGTGAVRANGALDVGTIRALDGTPAATIANSTGVITVSTQLNVDNINVSGNTISSTNTNGAINLTPNGTGTVVIPTADITNLDVTNIRALDGTAAATIANSTGVVTVSTQLNVDNVNINGNTISSTDTNGNITLVANGTGDVVLGSQITKVLGEIQATTDINYVFPPQTLNTVSDNNGFSAASSFPAGTNGYGANAGFTSYNGDTLAGALTSAAFNFRNAGGNSVTGVTVPFTGITSVAPSASPNTSVMGTLNFNGYATSGFTNDIATANQGGGINAIQAMQIQSYVNDTFSDSTLTLTSTNVTAVASSFRVAMTSPQVTGTKGQISFGATTPGVGTAVRVTGTLTGTATGIVSGQSYYIIVTNGSTTATLSATPGGNPIDTTAGTLTGLTLTRCGVTFTTTGLTNVPFGRGAKVAVSGVTNVTDGTYPVFGTPTTTSFALGIPHTVAPTVSGSQSFSCLTGYMGSGFRVRAFPAGIPANFQNRMDVIDLTPASGAIRSDSFVIAGGSYGNTGATYATFNATNTTLTKPLVLSGSTSGTVQISAPAVAGTQTYTLPTAQPTANNQILVSTTGGVMSWAAPTYLDAEWVTAIGTLTANTIYGLPVASVSANNVTIATGAIPIDDATSTGPTRITFPQTGRYNLQFSIQLKNTDSAEQDFDLWLRKNTVDVADSNTQITVIKQTGGNPGKNIMALNLLLNVTTAGDYYELVYATTSANLKPETVAAISSPYVRPRTPAVILTVVPVVGA